MDASACGRDLDTLLAPLVGADEAQKLTHRRDVALVCRPVRLFACLPHVRRAPQGNRVIRFERHQQHAQHACALRLRLPVQMESLGSRGGHWWRFARILVGAACHRLE
jgi:hypothetical protein